RRDELLRFFSVNRDIFLRTLCMVAVTVYFTTAGSRLGGLYLDANALLVQFFIIYSYFTDGLANAAEALSGKFVGRGDRQGLRVIVRQLFCWGGGLALFFTLCYVFGGSWILSILTNQQAVVRTALAYMVWVYAVPFVALAAFVWDGVYIGMTATRQMFLSMFVAAIVFFALWFLLGNRYGNHALWLAFLAYLATRGLMQTLLFRHY
ncbi:MAG: MATE family efflux transporter, partial [Bacteroidaceae bacterium]|nr:MATE family efflux transporter [Bacteroidaceae bacterium]